ncbi:unnamed protein product [Brassica oleracea var. botrytis]
MLSGDIINSISLVVLLLQDNNFSKDIPDTLLVNVNILDLRNNRLSGHIPEFINTQNISILLLRGNNFTGHIPHQLCGLSNIHLLDLANNGLSGPSCLSNISFGSGKEDTSNIYDFSFLYSNVVAIFNLSQNEFSGDIPEELGGLMELHALKLSHNYLSGVIPRCFSGLKTVESLDFSFNGLHGEIPPQLSELSNLGVFKVTYNNLSGVIPQGGHISTFDANSYLGNPFFCGKCKLDIIVNSLLVIPNRTYILLYTQVLVLINTDL